MRTFLVPDELANFIHIELGTKLEFDEIVAKVWDELRDKKLTYRRDKRVFRTNDELSEIFKIPPSVNESTNWRDPKGFNVMTLQKYIKNALKKTEEEMDETVQINSNFHDLPKILASEDRTWRRIKVMPFETKFDKKGYTFDPTDIPEKTMRDIIRMNVNLLNQ